MFAFFLFLVIGTGSNSFAVEPPQVYRNNVLALPATMNFSAISALGQADVSYSLNWGAPLISLPAISTYPALGGDPNKNFIEFFDRISLTPDSFIKIGELTLPLTCIWVHGQDNREVDEHNPLIPKQVYRYFLVANDFSCTGPINPGWPENGLKKQTWDTYIELLVKDLTIYRPAEAILRYRWNESKMVTKDVGPKQ